MASTPDLTGRQVDPLTVGGDLDGLHLLVRQALADGPGTRMVGKAQCADAGGLGEAVALDQPDAGGRLEAVPDRLGQGRGADHGEAEAADVGVDGQPARTEYTVGTALIVVTP